MSALDRDDWMSLTPKDVLHIWKYEEVPGSLRRIILYPLDSKQFTEIDEAILQGENEKANITGFQITLNGIGALMWEMCDGAHTIAQMVETIAKRFNVSTDQVALDVRRLLEQLEPYDVLEMDWSPL